MEPQTNNPVAPTQSAPAQHGVGPLVGTLIVLAVLVLGGVYFLTSTPKMQYEPPPVILGDPAAPQPMMVAPTSDSDAVTDISADVSATDLNDLEAQINADLEAVETNL